MHFEVCWEIPCGEASYISGPIPLIRGVSQVSGFCVVYVFTVENIGADYRFVIFRKGSCTTDLLVSYLDAALLSISGGGNW